MSMNLKNQNANVYGNEAFIWTAIFNSSHPEYFRFILCWDGFQLLR